MKIVEASERDLPELVSMAMDLWPGHEVDELKEEFREYLTSGKYQFLLAVEDHEPVAFIQLSNRHDYVEGSTSTPVGYVEGIYVKPEHRRKGIARKLIAAGEKWAKSKGCTQMASDVEIDNTDSLLFHLNIGFKETNRLIALIKDL